MKSEQLQDALSHISDKHLSEAAAYRRRSHAPVFRAIAACLALALIGGAVFWAFSHDNADISLEAPPTTKPIITEPTTGVSTEPTVPTLPDTSFKPEVVYPERLVAAPAYPQLSIFPTNSADYDLWAQQHMQWSDSRNALHNAPVGYADSLAAFWNESIPVYLSDNAGTNAVYSPVSLYLTLSILAQCTDGVSRQQILDLLGAQQMEDLAEQARLVFNAHYENDGVHTSILANSIWLDDAYDFRPDTVKTLADQFYASVYHGALESAEMNIALKDWLNAQTGGLLKDSIGRLDSMNDRTAMVIASTINYRCKWSNIFNPKLNTQDAFHGPAGDKTTTYMHGSAMYSPYFWGADYASTYLSLDDGNRLWLILPDEGYTPEDLLKSGNALDMIVNYNVYDTPYSNEPVYPDQKSVLVNLAVPKFDVSADLNLLDGLIQLGVTHALDAGQANFDGISPYDQDLYVSSAQQGVRVSIDEDGLTGVAYTLMGICGAGAPPEEQVDLILDRPFLFVLESSDGLPLFTGIVNQP